MTTRHVPPSFVAVAVIAAVASSSAVARGVGSDRCLTAPVEGQKLHRAGKLLAARDRYASCSTTACPAEVVEDCMRWMRQVDDALPSVVVAARDPKGRDLTDVRVSIDGKDPTELSARALRLDPGPHIFVFQRTGSANQEQRAVLREGEKNREVLATFGAPLDAVTSRLAPAASVRPVPLAAWVAGGVGVVALASFATFGTWGVLDRSSNHCDTGCSQDQKSAVDAKYVVADVSLGVAVVAAAVTTWLYLARPSVESTAPAVTSSRGFLTVSF